MIARIIFILFLVGGIALTIRAQLPVAHDLLMVANCDGNDSSMRLLGPSDMYEGTVENNFIQMDRIQSEENGEITLEVQSLNTNIEELEFRLENSGNSDEYFGVRLINNTLVLNEKYNGVASPISNLGAYQAGDNFRIVRCDNRIMYYIKNNLVNATELVNGNTFKISGVVEVTTTAGADFEARVTFHPL